jgi:ABC-type branched-subunit amino acid transport system substrate-binding protein
MTAMGAGARLCIGACLSLSGNFARFGSQAARALGLWQEMNGNLDLVIEDDESTPRALEASLPRVASQCDILLGPYSTRLMRTAGRMAAAEGWLLWNQGGSGDDVEASQPGHVVSVLTPTGRYAEPYLRHLAEDERRHDLWIIHGKGSFGRQVAAGAESFAGRLGFDSVRVVTAEQFKVESVPKDWNLFSVGRFEDDVEIVKQARVLPNPPRDICAVAAGVRDFGDLVDGPDGIYGVAQWFPGDPLPPTLGPAEADFLAAYAVLTNVHPDYPAIQAVAGAVLAEHCVRRAGNTRRESVWAAATELDTDTLFGAFKVNPRTGTQVKHETALVRWTGDDLRLHRRQRP